jgi:hypothetical protein
MLVYVVLLLIIFCVVYSIKTAGNEMSKKIITTEDLFSMNMQLNFLKFLQKSFKIKNLTDMGSVVDKLLQNKTAENINKITDIYLYFRYFKIRTKFTQNFKICHEINGLKLYNPLINVAKIYKHLLEVKTKNIPQPFGKSLMAYSVSGTLDIFTDEIITLKEEVKNLKKYKLYEDIMNMLNFISQFREINFKNIILILVEHVGLDGRGQHFDKIYRNSSDLFILNVGCDVYYDLIPVFVKGEACRVKIPNGYMTRLTDDVRYKWSHGLPDNIPNIKNRWSVQIKFRN